MDDLPSEIWAYSLAKKKIGTNTSIEMPSTRFSTRNGRIRKMLHLHQRRLGALLDEVEDHQQHRADHDAGDRAGSPQPQMRRLLESEHAEGDPGGDQHQPAVVHPGRPVVGLTGLETSIRTRAMIATGMLTQKIARQVHWVR